ncbi:hypothetical protein SUDANB96_04159 [Streptomyces sp. enrichment culture]
MLLWISVAARLAVAAGAVLNARAELRGPAPRFTAQDVRSRAPR